MAIPHAIGASSKAIATSSLCRGPHRPRQGQRRDGGASVWTSLDYALWALGRVSGFQWLMAGVRMAHPCRCESDRRELRHIPFQ